MRLVEGGAEVNFYVLFSPTGIVVEVPEIPSRPDEVVVLAHVPSVRQSDGLEFGRQRAKPILLFSSLCGIGPEKPLGVQVDSRRGMQGGQQDKNAPQTAPNIHR